MIREAEHRDVPAVVALHSCAFPGDFLGWLGPAWMEETFYPVVIASRNAALFVHLSDGTVGGFALLVLERQRLAGELLRRRRALLQALLRRAWRRPFMPCKIVGSGWTAREVVESLPVDIHSAPKLLRLAVRPEIRGAGVGTRLARRATDRAVAHAGCCLVWSTWRGAHLYTPLGYRKVGVRKDWFGTFDMLLCSKAPHGESWGRTAAEAPARERGQE